MKRSLVLLILGLVLTATAQDLPVVYTSFLTGVTLTGAQQTSVVTLTATRAAAITAAQAQGAAALGELDTLLDAANPDLSRIGTLSRQVRSAATQEKQAQIQFRRDVWQLLTPAQRDILLARLGQ